MIGATSSGMVGVICFPFEKTRKLLFQMRDAEFARNLRLSIV